MLRTQMLLTYFFVNVTITAFNSRTRKSAALRVKYSRDPAIFLFFYLLQPWQRGRTRMDGGKQKKNALNV